MSSLAAEHARLQELRRVVTATAMRYPSLSISAISRIYKALTGDVQAVLDRAGIRRGMHSPRDDFTEENVLADWAEGLSIQAMARKYDRSQARIRAIVGTTPAGQPGARREEGIAVSTELAADHACDGVDSSKSGEQCFSSRGKTVTRREVEERRYSYPENPLPWSQVAKQLGVALPTLYKALAKWGMSASQEAEQPAGADNPLILSFNRKGLPGSEARIRLMAMAHVMVDNARYDIDLQVREVG